MKQHAAGRGAAALSRALAPALFLLTFALRLHLLGAKNVWWDEALAIWAVRKPLAAVTLWTAGDVHPPLYFWSLWLWVRAVGQGEFAARVLTAGYGVLIAAFAYVLGRRVGGRSAGLIALGLVAVARFEIWWSMEMRMYALAALGIAGATYAALRWLDVALAPRPRAAHRSDLYLLGYVLAAAGALYTVYLAGVAVAVINAVVIGALLVFWLAGNRRGLGVLGRWIAAQLVVGLLLAPWLALALGRMQSWSSLRGTAAPTRFVAQLWATLIATGVSTDLDSVRPQTLVFWVAAFGLPLLLFVTWRAGSRETSVSLWREPPPRLWSGAAALLLIAFTVVPPIAVWLATQPRSIFYSPAVEARYLVPFAAPVYVLAAWALARVLRRSALVGGALLVVALVPLVSTVPDYYSDRHLRDDFKSMALAIWSQAEPGDVVVLVSGNRYPLFLYAYDQPWVLPLGEPAWEWSARAPAGEHPRPPVVPFPDRGSEPIDAHDWQTDLADLVARNQRVWLAEVEPHLQDPDGRVEQWLSAHMPCVLSESYGPNALHLFTREGDKPATTLLSRRFPGVVDVLGVQSGPTFGLAGGNVSAWGGGARGLPDDVPQRPEPTLAPLAGLAVSVLTPGDELDVTLFFAPGTEQGSETAERAGPALALMDDTTGLVVVSRELPAPSGTQVERTRVMVPVSERIPQGQYVVVVDRQELERSLSVEEGLPIARGVHPINASFDFVSLYRAGLSPAVVRPGESIAVDLYFAARGSSGAEEEAGPTYFRASVPDPPPVVFAHLVAPSPDPGSYGLVVAGQDGPPSSGGWLERSQVDSIFDRHVLEVPPDIEPGRYVVKVGLYDPETGRQLDVQGDDAHEADPGLHWVVAGTVEVESQLGVMSAVRVER